MAVIQIVSKDGKDICRTVIPYPPHIVKSMKQAGYKVRTFEDPSVAVPEAVKMEEDE